VPATTRPVSDAAFALPATLPATQQSLPEGQPEGRPMPHAEHAGDHGMKHDKHEGEHKLKHGKQGGKHMKHEGPHGEDHHHHHHQHYTAADMVSLLPARAACGTSAAAAAPHIAQRHCGFYEHMPRSSSSIDFGRRCMTFPVRAAAQVAYAMHKTEKKTAKHGALYLQVLFPA